MEKAGTSLQHVPKVTKPEGRRLDSPISLGNLHALLNLRNSLFDVLLHRLLGFTMAMTTETFEPFPRRL